MLKNNNRGFTIIEVLMVLAIAGLIMLIVFLAVPALQRNSRNTQRKNDVSSAIGAFSEYLSNNNGALPTVAVGLASAKLGFFAIGDFTGSTVQTTTVASVTSNGDGVVINNYARCPATLPAANTAAVPMGTNATKRNVAAVYQIEISNGFQASCVDM